jgi:rhodanese-related sulfurtransferase
MEQTPHLTLAELRTRLDAGEPVWLVYAPDAAAFADGHIPGSLDLPHTSVLLALARRAPVVVYGEDAEVLRAPAIARAHPGLGIRWFRDGLAGWRASGLPVDALGPGDRRTDL